MVFTKFSSGRRPSDSVVTIDLRLRASVFFAGCRGDDLSGGLFSDLRNSQGAKAGLPDI
jgi:hypothetical protein